MTIWVSLGLFVVLIWLGGYAVGSLLARAPAGSATERALFAFPLGSAAVGWVEFCASEFGRVPITAAFLAGVVLPLAGVGLGLLGRDVRAWRRTRANAGGQRRLFSPDAGWTRMAWVELGVILLLFVRQTPEYLVTPTVGLDALRYHFPFAKIIYQTHALPQFTSPSLGDLFFSNPPLPFLWYANVWLWLGQVHLFIPIVTALVMGVHVCLLVYFAARRLLGVSPQAALGAVLCLLLPGIFINLVQILKSSTDIPYAFWGVATAYWWLRDEREGTASRWPWVGVCGGLMAWIKPYGYVLSGVYIGLILFGWAWRRRAWARAWPHSWTAFGTLTAVWVGLLIPLLLDHWLLWGNPVYPAFGHVLGGSFINDWSLRHNAMLLTFRWDWDGILDQLLTEPVVALGGFALLHPVVRKDPVSRTVWLIAFLYPVLYAGLFGKTLTNLIPGAHARYLLPSIVLFGLLVSCFLDGRVEPGNREVGWILLAALVVQTGLVSDALWSDRGHSRIMVLRNLASFRLSALISEWMPFFLAGGFWVTERFIRHSHVGLRVRLAALCAGCLVLTPAWALAEPWQMLFKPAQWRMVDWTAIPLVSPYGPWAQAHLPRSAVLLVDDDRRWIIPRQILPVDSPLLQDLYRSDRPLMNKLERLARLGVTHIVTKGERGQPLPLRTDWMAGSLAWPFLAEQESEHYFKQIYRGPPVPYAQDPLGWNDSETYLYEIVYPPRLKKLVESPLPRPWLYGYATVGSLNP